MGKSLEGINDAKLVFKAVALTAGVSGEIDLGGGTFCGVMIDSEITSTYFTVTASRASGGTFVSLKDPTGRYGTAGAAVQFTVGSTSLGYHSVPPELTAGLQFIKLNFNQSETPTVYAVYRSFE